LGIGIWNTERKAEVKEGGSIWGCRGLPPCFLRFFKELRMYKLLEVRYDSSLCCCDYADHEQREGTKLGNWENVKIRVGKTIATDYTDQRG
jgi:hypothetical protein